MKKLRIEPGCISCGSCEFIAPNVFYLNVTSNIKDNIDIDKNLDIIKLAIQKCPVGVIKLVDKDE